MADGGIYVWERIEDEKDDGIKPVAPEEGGPRNWMITGVSTYLNLRKAPSTSSGIIGRYSEGDILDNLGCKKGMHRVWCDVQKLGGGLRGYVAAEYLMPAVSPDGPQHGARVGREVIGHDLSQSIVYAPVSQIELICVQCG